MRLSQPLPLTPVWLFLHEAGEWKYHLALMIFTLLIGLRKIATVRLMEGVDSLYMTFATSAWVLLFALLTRIALYGTRLPYQPRSLRRYMLTLGGGTCMGMVGSILALQYISPVLDSLLSLVLYSFAVSVFAWWFGRGETIHFKAILSIIGVATIGIIIFSAEELRHTDVGVSLLGYLWSIVGIIGWAVSIVAVTNLVRANVPIVDAIAIRFTVPVLALLPYLLLTHRLQVNRAFLEIALVSLVGYFVPFLISFATVRKLSVVTFAISTMSSPVVVYVMSVIFLDHAPLTVLQWLGGAIIFGAVGYRLLSDAGMSSRLTRRMTLQLLEKLRD